MLALLQGLLGSELKRFGGDTYLAVFVLLMAFLDMDFLFSRGG
jgi:hypothetical protein